MKTSFYWSLLDNYQEVGFDVLRLCQEQKELDKYVSVRRDNEVCYINFGKMGIENKCGLEVCYICKQRLITHLVVLILPSQKRETKKIYIDYVFVVIS